MRIKKYGLLLISLVCLAAGMVMIKTNFILAVGIPYILLGFGCILFGESTGQLFQAWSLKKTPDVARSQAIEEKDERNIQIRSMAKAKGFDMLKFALLPLIMAFGFQNESFSVIIPLVAVLFFVQCYAIYWRVKLEKTM